MSKEKPKLTIADRLERQDLLLENVHLRVACVEEKVDNMAKDMKIIKEQKNNGSVRKAILDVAQILLLIAAIVLATVLGV